MTAEHVLLLGGTRFIGPHVVQALRAAGYEPTVFHRGKSAWPMTDAPAPTAIAGDRKEPAELAEVARLRDWSAVIDLCAYTAADSTQAIAAFNERCGVFVHISTGSVYQVLRDYHNPYGEEDALLFAESLPLMDAPLDHPGMAYGMNKRACEEALFSAHEETGFPVTVIRPPIVSGPLDHSLRDYSYLLRLRDGGPVLVPVNSGSFRHIAVQDLAGLVVATIDQWDASVGEAFNAGGATIFSLSEYLQAWAQLLGLPEPVLMPVPFDTIATEIGEGALPFGYLRNAIPDIQKAETILDWHPRRADQYLPEVAAWFDGEYTGPKPESYTAYRDKELAYAGSVVSEVG